MSNSSVPIIKPMRLEDFRVLDLHYLECVSCRDKKAHGKPWPAVSVSILVVVLVSLYLKLHFGDRDYDIQVILMAMVIIAGYYLYRSLDEILERRAKRKAHLLIKAKQGSVARRAQNLIVGHDRLVYRLLGQNGWLAIQQRASAKLIPALENFYYRHRHDLGSDKRVTILSCIAKAREMQEDDSCVLSQFKDMGLAWRGELAGLYRAGVVLSSTELEPGILAMETLCVQHERILADLEKLSFDESRLREAASSISSQDDEGYLDFAQAYTDFQGLESIRTDTMLLAEKIFLLLKEAVDGKR